MNVIQDGCVTKTRYQKTFVFQSLFLTRIFSKSNIFAANSDEIKRKPQFSIFVEHAGSKFTGESAIEYQLKKYAGHGYRRIYDGGA